MSTSCTDRAPGFHDLVVLAAAPVWLGCSLFATSVAAFLLGFQALAWVLLVCPLLLVVHVHRRIVRVADAHHRGARLAWWRVVEVLSFGLIIVVTPPLLLTMFAQASGSEVSPWILRGLTGAQLLGALVAFITITRRIGLWGGRTGT